MVNYQLGKIYKIVGNGKAYIGSTCERLLCQRLTNHKAKYKQYQMGIGGNMTSFQCLSDPKHYIELLELYPCCSKDELHKCERKWIEQLDCINKVIPGRTKKEYRKEYYETNKDAYKEYYETHKEQKKAYYETHYEDRKDKINEQRRLRRLKNKQIINQDL
jgi:hypothetical protein